MSVEIRYVKRILMTFDLGRGVPELILPRDFYWVEWSPELLKRHARLIHDAFRNDLDGQIFPTYKQYSACEHLIESTVSSTLFAPKATWLIARSASQANNNSKRVDYCAAIQCVFNKAREGEIQNVSVRADVRRKGLGKALVIKALEAFNQLDVKVVKLEVTAENSEAIRLYSSLGFRPLRYFYTESFVETKPFIT